ncbi:MAG TPA: hypothetical protein VJO53_02960 [Candidatus Acidoferrales bacterium]|nr:hypothetical protein [Candidatus Acidoferrales bacterium]
MRHFEIPLTSALAAAFVLAIVSGAAAQPASAGPAFSEQLGQVNFPTSCAHQVQGAIEKGVALLHSFQYQESEQAFTDASEQDALCAISRWGQAMALDHQLWDFPSTETLAKGSAYIDQAQKLDAKTGRERAYIAAAAAFYKDDPKLTHTARVEAYSAAMATLSRDNPQDSEAAAFYALSLVSLAYDDVDALASRKKAIAILEPLFAQQPDDPGFAHYLIHATDTPELATQGLAAARAYAKIAPDSSHAIHMPSHIFRRLGLWPDVIDSNLAAIAAAAAATQAHRGDASYQFHAMDFLDYAYLQSGQEAKARQVVDGVKTVPGATGAQIVEHQSDFAVQNAIELHRWKEAASLPIPDERLDLQDIVYWARAIGAARSGDLEGARADVQKLTECIAARDARGKERGDRMPMGEAADQLEAEGWLAYAEVKSDDAVAKLRAAADREDSDHSDPFSTPAREMLADLLFELKRPADAVKEYDAVLKDYPNRFDALYGAARSAAAAANPVLAQKFYIQLVAISLPGADRPELQDARSFAYKN